MKSNPRNHNTGRVAREPQLAGSELPLGSQGKVQRREAPHRGRERRPECVPTEAREPREKPLEKEGEEIPADGPGRGGGLRLEAAALSERGGLPNCDDREVSSGPSDGPDCATCGVFPA